MTTSRIKLEINGMSCAGCASKITAALQRDQRVASAVIDYATHSGVVDGDIPVDDIKEIIKSLGYQAGETKDNANELEQQTVSPNREVARLIAGGLLSAPVVILAMGPWELPFSGVIQLVLTTIFLAWPASGFFTRAFKQLRHKFVTMDTLVALGAGSAWTVSVVMVYQGHQHLYFETAVLIGFFVLLGKALEDQARRRSIGEVDRLIRLRPRTLWKIDSSGIPTEVSVASVALNDVVYLRPGDMLAVDAVVEEGSVSVDESVVTGESEPVVKSPGEAVCSGAVNAGATGVRLRVTRIGKDTTVEQIIQLIEDARFSRPPIQKFADQVSSIFVPVVIILAVITWIFAWQISDIDFLSSLMRGLSVLVVACPCALGLATPVAWVAGLGRAAKSGVLVRSYEALETLRKANVVVFDKTGTLTYGAPKVTNVVVSPNSDNLNPFGDMLSAVSHSSHPLARAISNFIKNEHFGMTIPLSKLIEEKAGQGVVCEIKDGEKRTIRYGRPSFVAQGEVSEWQESIYKGHSIVAVSCDGKPLLLFELKDALRDDVQESLAALQERQIDVYVASGDKDAVVKSMVSQLKGIKSSLGGMTPSSKKELVETLRQSGKVVAFVGDGMNDAPALAAADVGISLASGTDLAAHSSGLILQKPGLNCLIDAIEVSTRITKIIRENFFWAFFYNVAAIPLAMAGMITPMWAAGAMAMSSISVVVNALRLIR